MASFTPDSARSSRMSDQERAALLDKLDADDANNPAKNRRSMSRVTFRRPDVAVRIHHPGGSMTTATVATRNLSTGGTSFIYHGFLHKNTKVEIVLHRRLGGQDVIAGVVTHCAHLNRAFHLIGMRFASKIFAKLYLDPTDWSELGDGPPVDPASLAGGVVHLDASEMDRLLLRHNLSSTKIELASVSTVEEAVESLKAKPADCVLVEPATVGQPFAAVMAAIRGAGFTGPVGVLTGESTTPVLKSLTDAGASAVLAKPYDASKLLSMLATWLAAGAGSTEAIYSTLPETPATKPLVEQYVQRVRQLVKELRRSVESNDLKNVRAVCQTLRGTGAGFGFASLSQYAKDAVGTLDQTASIQEAMVHLQRLELTCRGLALK